MFPLSSLIGKTLDRERPEQKRIQNYFLQLFYLLNNSFKKITGQNEIFRNNFDG